MGKEIGFLCTITLPVQKQVMVMEMKVLTIVQARMNSTRLPGKNGMIVWDGLTLTELVLARVTKSKLAGRIVLATTERAVDSALIPSAEMYGVDVFRGSEMDVLGRFIGALDKYGRYGVSISCFSSRDEYVKEVDYVVRISADNPFIDPDRIDELITFFDSIQPCDYASNMVVSGYPDAVGAEIVTPETLRRIEDDLTDVIDNKTRAYHREHVLTWVQNNSEYKRCVCMAKPELTRPQYRIDIDYQEDLDFVRELANKLPEKSAPFWTTEEIIKTLDENPNLLEIRKIR
jgi:spore coat polysaccharide biosynthesis protein SpsF